MWTFFCFLLWLPVSFATLFRGSHAARRMRMRINSHEAPSVVMERRDAATPSDFADGGGSCTLGAWQCVGQNLQRCYNGQWNSWTTCDGQSTVCSASNPLVAPGCVWAGGASAGQLAPSDTRPVSACMISTSPVGPTGTSSDAAVSAPSVSSDTLSFSAVSTTTQFNNYYAQQDSSLYSASQPTSQSTFTAMDQSSTPSISATSGISDTSTNSVASASTLAQPSASSTTSVASASTSAQSSPSSSDSSSSGGSNRTSDSSQFTAPHYVMYTDDVHFPLPKGSELVPINRYLLAFWLTNSPDYDNSFGPFDVAKVWALMPASERQAVLDDYHSNGIALMVTAFGSTDVPVTTGVDPVVAAQKLAEFCIQYGLDGVDLDWEDSGALVLGTGEAWLISFHQELRKQLPVGQYIISHAPQPPYFGGIASGYPKGGYATVHKEIGDTIDFYNMQYYNQPNLPYEDCASIVDASQGTAMLEISKSAGVPLDKMVIGKPLSSKFVVSRGLMTASQLNTCVKDARGKGWNAGIMVWQMHSTGQAFFQEASA